VNWQQYIEAFDDRRDIINLGNREETIQFCIDQFFTIAKESIKDHGTFTVALSGGSTPKAIYQGLKSEHLDWSKVYLFWSDERAVTSDHPNSNYHMAIETCFKHVPIPSSHIFRMKTEDDIEKGALEYDQLISSKLFDLVMLGLGEDGHTASLFPKTHGLHTTNRSAIANFIPQLNTWRMSLTFDCINQATHIIMYVIGKQKADILHKILTAPYNPDELPAQRIGTPTHKLLIIVDDAALEIRSNSKGNK